MTTPDTNTIPYTDTELVNSIRSTSKSGYRNVALRSSDYPGGKAVLVATIANGKREKFYLGVAPVDQSRSLALLVGLIHVAKRHGGDPSVLVGRTKDFERKDLNERIKLARQFLADTIAMAPALSDQSIATPSTLAPARSGRNERKLKFIGFITPSNPVPNGVKRSKAALDAFQNAMDALLGRAEEAQEDE